MVLVDEGGETGLFSLMLGLVDKMGMRRLGEPGANALGVEEAAVDEDESETLSSS